MWWTALTYAYNGLLVLFIATHLLVGAIISFIAGLYIGIYLCQNYSVPNVSEPSKLWDKLINFMEQYRLQPGNVRKGKFHFVRNLARPSTIKEIILDQDSNKREEEQQEFKDVMEELTDSVLASKKDD